MAPQARRKALSSGNYGGIPCLHFDPRTGDRCSRPAGEGVFCNNVKHTACWEELTEEQQTQYNALLTNSAVAYDRESWAEIFVQCISARHAARHAPTHCQARFKMPFFVLMLAQWFSDTSK